MNKQLYTNGLKEDPCVYPGFDPDLILKEACEKHFPGILRAIRREDYTPEDKFSTVNIQNQTD